jgi:hypothetical protein
LTVETFVGGDGWNWTALNLAVANAKEVIAMGEDSWRNAVYPMSYGLDPVRGWGFNDLRPPGKGDKRGVWDWAGVGGTWCGSYAFLE